MLEQEQDHLIAVWQKQDPRNSKHNIWARINKTLDQKESGIMRGFNYKPISAGLVALCVVFFCFFGYRLHLVNERQELNRYIWELASEELQIDLELDIDDPLIDLQKI